MLRVWSDILTAADQRQCHVTLLGLLEMSALQRLIASTMTFCYRDYSSGSASLELFLSDLQFSSGSYATGPLQWAGDYGSAAVIRCSTVVRKRKPYGLDPVIN